MKIIRDYQKQLNLHPQMVYFMLSSNEYMEYAKLLEELSNYSGYSRGIFKFHAVQRGKEYSHDLKSDLTDIMGQYNVIVRLIDDGSGSYTYALHKQDFNLQPDEFEDRLQAFIIDVCKQNLKNLQGREKHYAGLTAVNSEKIMMINSLKASYRGGVEAKGFKRGVWQNLLDSTDIFMGVSESRQPRPKMLITRNENIILPKMPSLIDQDRDFIYSHLTDKRAKDAFKHMMAVMDGYMDTPDVKESDKIANGATDNTKSSIIQQDHQQRFKPQEAPKISVTIARIKIKERQDGSKIKIWGVVFNIDGTQIEVNFGSETYITIYIAALLRKKAGTHLYRGDFLKPLPDANSPIKRNERAVWIESVYNFLFPHPKKDFEEWYRGLSKARGFGNNQTDGGTLSQAKSNCNTKIKTALFDFNSAIYFCSLQREEDEYENSYYEVHIPKENIHIPKEMEELLKPNPSI